MKSLNKTDFTGKKFGKLTVLEKAEDYVQSNGGHITRWKCLCDCGNEVVVNVYSLKNGHTKSCGCYQKEVVAKTGYKKKQYNQYDLSNEYGIGYTNKDEKFYFDLEDYDKIKDYCWCENGDGYLITKNDMHKTIRQHRLIMGCSNSDIIIDHINHNRMDNRKSNLRICTRSQNNMNAILHSNNSSGMTGVHYEKRRNHWVSEITIDYHKIYLGHFDNFEDAVKARKEAEEKYFGEYSFSNSMKGKGN